MTPQRTADRSSSAPGADLAAGVRATRQTSGRFRVFATVRWPLILGALLCGPTGPAQAAESSDLLQLAEPTVLNVAADADRDAASALSPTGFPDDLGSLSDVDLTLLNGRWVELAPEQRTALLRENRRRMGQRAARSRTVVPGARSGSRVRVERRFGVVRRSDGGVVAIQRREIVRVQPGQQRFGVGFERRRQEAQPSEAIPASATDLATQTARIPDPDPTRP